MAFACDAYGCADQPYQCIARNAWVCGGTRVTGLAATIHLARRNPGEPYPWTFCAPHRTIAIPNAGRSACEYLAGRNDVGGNEERHYHSHALPIIHAQIPHRISLRFAERWITISQFLKPSQGLPPCGTGARNRSAYLVANPPFLWLRIAPTARFPGSCYRTA